MIKQINVQQNAMWVAIIKFKTLAISKLALKYHPLVNNICENDIVDFSCHNYLLQLSDDDIKYQINKMVLPVIEDNIDDNSYLLLSNDTLYFHLAKHNASKNMKVALRIYPKEMAEKIIQHESFIAPALQYRSSKNTLACLHARYSNIKKQGIPHIYNLRLLAKIVNIHTSAIRKK
ncbi:hypothetical protein [Photobacterium leiognathi]|uniref:hypothetical protein n=1 Tax=Photobacterium leiognathi TaxID=553611 RepID=UPI00298187D4|nr:hypothetical protein [Photobacterium leiognathi]